MPRIRVCQIITELRLSGAERAMYELSVRLDRSRFDVHVVGLRGGVVGDWLARQGIPVTVLGVRGKWDLGKLRSLTRILREGRFDLVHTHLFHADLAGRLAARRAGVPHFVHTEQVAEMRFRPWQFAWARWTAGWCDRIICCSAAVRDHHARRSHLPLSRYEVIYNGIDADAYARDEARRESLRAAWSVRPGQVLVAWVARLDPQKNVALFLRAVEAARAERGIRVVMAGDGPERPRVEEFLQQGGHEWLTWLGHSGDVPGILSAADLLAMPSRWEGFGLAAAEAMAAELPVIGTKVPGLTEVIADGETGILIESGDLAALRAAVFRLADDADLRRRMGQAGRRRVREKFTLAANVAAHERLYGAVCGI